MKTLLSILLVVVLHTTLSAQKKETNADGWITLFDGQTLAGWKASEHPGTFTVLDGMIVAFGDRAHLFYTGSIMDHTFKNFEFKAQVMTTPGSNSGIFIHSVYHVIGDI